MSESMISENGPPGQHAAAIDWELFRADIEPLFENGYTREVTVFYEKVEGEKKKTVPKAVRVDSYEAAEQFVARADADSPLGIYVGLNPLNLPVGVGRAESKNVPFFEHIFFDFDVSAAKAEKRPATDQERLVTVEARKFLQQKLLDLGFTHAAARTGCSSNGQYLILLAGNLPNDPEHRVVIRAATSAAKHIVEATFPDIEIDTGVSNADRVRRISGTRNRKHGATSLCELVVYPHAKPISLDVLRKLAALAPDKDRYSASDENTGPRPSGTITLTDDEKERIATACKPHRYDGNRHNTARSIGGWMAHTRISRDSAIEAMKVIAADDSDPDDRINGVSDTYDRYELGHGVLYKDLPDQLLAELQRIGQVIKTRTGPKVAENGKVDYPPTDTGNAERLVARHGDNLRHNYGRGCWLHWTGTHWAEDNDGTLDRLAKETVRSIPEEAVGLEGEGYTKKLKWAASSENSGKRSAMIDLARSEVGIPVQPHELDQGQWLLNVANGTIDLRTGKLRKHDRADLITRCLGTPYEPNASCPTFMKFLARIFNEDQELIDYVQRMVGYSLTGSTREQVILIAYGNGANGKSTLLGILSECLEDYATQANTDSFMERKNDRVPEDIAALEGARFVAASETADGRRLSEAFVKKATGGEKLRARRLFENGYEFAPQFKIWLSTNHRPTIIGTDHAIWRRIRLIPFTVTIPKDEQDRKLPEKLQAELPGILAWAVEGCRRWLDEGEMPPPAVLQATERYRRDMDALGDWLEDRCALRDGAKIPTKELYQDYTQYCERAGEEPLKQRTFGIRLTDRGIGESRSKSTRFRTGITLRDSKTPQQEPFPNGQGDGMTDVTQYSGTPHETHSPRKDTETSVTSVIVSPRNAQGVERWLYRQLESGPKAMSAVRQAAKDVGISPDALNDARIALQVRTQKVGADTCWALSSDARVSA